MHRRTSMACALLLLELTAAPAPAVAQAMCRCECRYIESGRRVCRRVCVRAPLPAAEYPTPAVSAAPYRPTGIATPALPSGAESSFTLLLIATGAILLIHYLRRLAAVTAQSPAPAFGQPAFAPAPSLFSRWGSRRVNRLARDAELIRARTDVINARVAQAEARRLLVELVLSEDERPQPAPAPAESPDPALSLAELERLINAMHELDPAQRAALLRVLALRLEESRA